MRAVVIPRHGGPEVLELRELPPVPDPGPGQVRVDVRAVALNHLDLWVRRGHAGLRVELPYVPGSDICGVVGAVGEGVTRVAPGQPVVAFPALYCHGCAACLAGRHNHCRSFAILGEHAPGGLAEQILLPERNLYPLPAGLSSEEGAAFPLAWLTSWHMLARKVALAPGDWVLIQAAASGTGLAALQIARLFGARVLATAGSAEKCARLVAMGAERTVNYREQDLKAVVKEATGGRGCTVVVDHLGATTFSLSLSCLAREGTYLTCGATTGPGLTFDARHLFIKHQRIIGSTMGDAGDFQALLAHMGPAPGGGLHPVVHRVFPMAQIRAAHEELESRGVVGKVVIRVGV
ncbi:MAG: zinc-binding dehydrogenase [bacterium]|nr:zinc-binding dehydrogenase [bacterium]